MPGIIVFRRRWGVGSDDLVVPGLSLSLLHIIWFFVTAITLASEEHDEAAFNDTRTFANASTHLAPNIHSEDATTDTENMGKCQKTLSVLLVVHTIVLVICIILEIMMVRTALKGTMWNFAPRQSMEYILYARLFVLAIQVIWSSLSIVWLHAHYFTCPVGGMGKEVLLGLVICNACVTLSVVITVWCTFDRAGRSWVKMKRFQRSMRDGETKYHYKRSGNNRPNWRQRKVMRTYQDTWNHRCKFLFCCMSRSDQYQDSFSEIARLLTDFFRDLDLVPTDIVAGLVLLRKQQKKLQETQVRQLNGIYEFLSGVPVTSQTRFLCLSEPDQLEAFQLAAHYMKFALAAYGWPMYLLGHSTTGLCLLCSRMRCCCCMNRSPSRDNEITPVIVGDTCSRCHLAALRQACGNGNFEVIYATFHVDVAETPFFVAIDYDHKSVIVSIRGTISMKDVITDLHAEAEPIPLQVPVDDWFGHKGMVQCALYIRNKLAGENLLERAFSHKPEKGTPEFQLILVGHSLGAGTAAILALLLRDEYPNLHCYAYSPPGGLLSLPAADFTKQFVTSVVVGKDVVPRLGLHQLETLRSNLITAIKKSTEPKWKILGSSLVCCRRNKEFDAPTESAEDGPKEVPFASFAAHPSDPNITLSIHQPLYPPGRIIHIVRQHPKDRERNSSRWNQYKSEDPIYQAVWAETTDFKEVLISPVMVQDHMPDNVLHALQKVLSSHGPTKPQRASPTALLEKVYDKSSEHLRLLSTSQTLHGLSSPCRMYLETSFTSIDKSPTLGCRVFDDSSLYSSSAGSAKPVVPPFLWNELECSTRVRRATSDILPDHWDYMEAISEYSKSNILPDHTLQSYSSFLVAPVATPESLSEESSIGSKNSIARRAKKLWRKEKMRKQLGMPLDCPSSVLTKSGQNVIIPEPENSDPCAGSDIVEMTEGSSVYCLSPLSSVRASAVPSRLQLKREIMRLYQRAAADVEISDGSPRFSVRQVHSVRTSSRSATNSSPSQPSSVSQCTGNFTFPTGNLSPVFGASHYRNRANSESSNAESSPIPRPATANGNSPFGQQAERPNRNTSF